MCTEYMKSLVLRLSPLSCRNVLVAVLTAWCFRNVRFSPALWNRRMTSVRVLVLCHDTEPIPNLGSLWSCLWTFFSATSYRQSIACWFCASWVEVGGCPSLRFAAKLWLMKWCTGLHSSRLLHGARQDSLRAQFISSVRHSPVLQKVLVTKTKTPLLTVVCFSVLKIKKNKQTKQNKNKTQPNFWRPQFPARFYEGSCWVVSPSRWRVALCVRYRQGVVKRNFCSCCQNRNWWTNTRHIH